MLRVLRRFLILLAALLLPIYGVSLSEDLEIPPAWRQIAVGDSHAQVRAHLRESGMADQQCEWLGVRGTVRCTLVGRHHAAGISITFDSAADDARVAAVKVHDPVYTGPFHLHVRLKRGIR